MKWVDSMTGLLDVYDLDIYDPRPNWLAIMARFICFNGLRLWRRVSERLLLYVFMAPRAAGDLIPL